MTSTTPTLALVHGLGVSGLAAARLLRRRGVPVVGVDRRSRLELELGGLEHDPGVDLILGAEITTPPAATDLVVVSPGVAFDHPLLVASRSRHIEVLGELELGYRALPADAAVIAITGSNGKSTTTALTGHLLEAAGRQVEVCGNIGRPLCDCAEGASGRTFVVEVSSFQLETISTFHAGAAAILNLSPDHLERHRDLAGYARAKGRVFETQNAHDVAVVNGEDSWIRELPGKARRRAFSTARRVPDGCFLADDGSVVEVDRDRERALFAAKDVPLPGLHNLENAMAAALLARALGAPAGIFAAALATFRGLPHRVELVATINGVRFVDDSKATNVASAIRGLAGFPGAAVHAIVGGRAKSGDDLELLSTSLAATASSVWLIGEAEDAFSAALSTSALPVHRVGSLERAVGAAAAAASPGDVVLLAPAAASYDQYRNYVERGLHFRTRVGELAAHAKVGA